MATIFILATTLGVNVALMELLKNKKVASRLCMGVAILGFISLCFYVRIGDMSQDTQFMSGLYNVLHFFGARLYYNKYRWA